MCGLCGIVYTSSSSQTIDNSLLNRMTQTLLHRGPDAQNTYVNSQVGLGHCRLSIIDLTGGAQPMPSDDGKTILAFNGEIYNFLELRKTLEKLGCRFKTHSDTEVLLRLYESEGPDCVHKLRGMFAFAIWDGHKKELFVARDRLGKKPFYYAQLPNGFVFASEMKAILEHPGIAREIDLQALDLYLTYMYIPSPRTIFKGIAKLPPAYYAIWKDGDLSVRSYWHPSFREKTSLSVPEATTQLFDKLKESVRLRMIADVPLGAFLSGGIDSSIVVGMMSESSSKPVKTFCIGFEDQDMSESRYAQMVAKRFGCDHHDFVVRPDTIDILPRLAWHYDEPFADPSALPSYFVARETRKHVTVALNGDGGDENFAGYYRYAAMGCLTLWNQLPQLLRTSIAGLASHFPGKNESTQAMWRLKRFLSIGADTPENQYFELINVFSEEQKRDLYTPRVRQQVNQDISPRYIADILNSSDARNWLDRYLSADLSSYLPECLMKKMDIASMANSLETRSPFLDHEFVEMAARLPTDLKWRPLLRTKWILRHGLKKGWLPDEILSRGKQGFITPMGRWFRKELNAYLKEMIISDRALARGYFEADPIRQMLHEHEQGRADHSHQLWTLLMLELWHRVYIDRDYTFP